MPDPISVVCLVLLLWLVVRDLSRKTFRPEPPLLPQHQNNVRYTVPVYSVEQQSVSEHQHQEEALPPKARYVQLQHEQVVSARVQPSQSVPLPIPSVPQERNEAPLQPLPQQINEPGQSPILVPQPFVSPTNSGGQAIVEVPQLESVQIHKVAGTPVVPGVSGAPQSPQDNLGEWDGDYASLRERAKEEAKAKQKCQEEKREAKAKGQKALARELKKEAKKHGQRRQQFDEQASSLIFTKNNKNRPLGLIDLHGLRADEAVTYAKRAISDARGKDLAEMRFIVGKGLHSSGPPVLKPSMLKLMKKLKLSAEIDPLNEGVLVVQLPSANKASPPAVSQDQAQTLPKPLSPQISSLGESPILFPEFYLSPVEPNQQSDGVFQSPVEDCQAVSAFNEDEEISQIPQELVDINVEDEANDPVMIRRRANEARKLMLNCRKEKKLAQAKGQKLLARDLAEKEIDHRKRSELLHEQASELIFARNNKSGHLDTVVLLDLKSKEAKKFAKRAIQVARGQGKTELRVVVGDGPYSEDGPYPIKSVLSKFLKKKRKIPFKVDPMNSGILVVSIGPECDNI